MVVLPAPLIVTVPSDDTVATAWLLLLVYVKAPLLLLVGAVRLKDASPKFLAGADNAPMVGAIGETTNDAVTLPLL
jgi:hypothetical protein